MKAKDFLSVSKQAIPAARFSEEDDAWAHDPWAVIRESARTGRPCEEIAGSPVEVRADRPGMESWTIIE